MHKYKFIDDISKLSFVDKIILFGSRAREENDDRSDIDLAISCENATSEDWLEILDSIENNLETLLKIDCVRLDKLESADKLKQNIEQQGKIIYCKDEQRKLERFF